jgi:hypothetical protein
MLNSHHHERGQTIPFWVFAVITSLALSLFIMNYTNTVRWHIRAQNAADAAAITAMAGEASLMNQRTLAQYSAALSEYRLRGIMYSMINAANAVGLDATQSQPGAPTKTCDPTIAADDTGIDCDNAYDQQPYFYDQAMSQYVLAVQALEKLANPSPPPNVTPAPVPSGVPTPAPVPSAPSGSTAPAAFSLVQSDKYCWDKQVAVTPNVFDCAFYYNADLSNTGPGSKEVADVVACRTVTSKFPFFIGGMLSPSFNAVGRAAATLKPIPETFSPGTSVDPHASVAGTAYQPVENCPANNGPGGGTCNPFTGWMNSPSYSVDYGLQNNNTQGFEVQATFFVPVLTTPLNNPKWVLSCEQG